MTSYPEFTFPRRNKRTVKEKVIPLTDEPESEPVFSTLSKKPADLKTTDIDLSAIRVFLVDGSHRTISSTPETTCGEILDRLLGKLGLLERRTEYALQIKYSFSEPRTADDSEQISKLNTHVWDSVDRIYLCKKDMENFPTATLRRKRLASFDGVLEPESSVHDGCAVIDKHMVETDIIHTQQPVVVNEQLALRFAEAWNVGSKKQQAGESGGQKPMTSTIVFRPATISLEEAKPNFSPKMKRKNTYPQESKPKDSTIRRQHPVYPRNASSVELPTCSKSPPIPPKRISAYIHNCTIPDEELLKQGRRISQMLLFTPKKEGQESKTLRTMQAAFNRFGTLLRKARSPSDNSLPLSPTLSGKRGLGFPDSPVPRRHEVGEYVQKDKSPSANSLPLSPTSGKRGLGFPDSPVPRRHEVGEYVQKDKSPSANSLPLSPTSEKRGLEFPDSPAPRRREVEEYDIAVPVKTPVMLQL